MAHQGVGRKLTDMIKNRAPEKQLVQELEKDLVSIEKTVEKDFVAIEKSVEKEVQIIEGEVEKDFAGLTSIFKRR